METKPNHLKDLSFKQKFFLFFYKSNQFIYRDWLSFKQRLSRLNDSFLLITLLFCIGLFFVQRILNCSNIIISQEQLSSLGFAVAGIIGASIAIMFSFSTFILQSTADLFSTQYLNKFIQDKKEKFIFWTLVLLTMVSFLTPLLISVSVIEILLSILFLAFLLIYSLYKELRKRINPETTLSKIRNDALYKIKRANKELVKHANIQNKIFEYDENSKALSIAIQYKSKPNWNTLILEDVKYLYEIGLRLLSKNEINSFNLTLVYIRDIYLRHLAIRNGHIMRIPASFWGSYTFEDEGFTTKTLEYLESISNRVIQDRRKENIYFLLNIYEDLMSNTQHLAYADKNIGSQGENPILSLIIGYYIGLLDKLIQSKETDWIWESIKSLSKVSNILLSKEYNHFNYSQISQAVDRIILACIAEKNQEAFLKEVVKIYFNQIKISWNKYSNNEIFWRDLFKSLKKSTIALSFETGINLSVSELYIDFHEWVVNVINAIFDLEDKKEQEKLKNEYIKLLERWSNFLLDLARDVGLENKNIGLPVIQSVENNLRIIYGIKAKFDSDLSKIYKTQLNIISWYFEKTDKVDESFLFNLEQIQETLLREIDSNLKGKVFDTKDIIKLYIQLVKQHFEKASVGYGYNHPRITEKLIHLGLILTKHKQDTKNIVTLIEELSAKYLVLNKEYFKMKLKEPNLMGPDEYQLCEEISDLKNDLFSHSSGMVMGIKDLLKQEIGKEVFDQFIGQIEYCKGIEYTTVSSF